MPRTRLSAILYLALVFGSGILVGVVSNRLYAVKASGAAPAASAPRNMEEFRKRYMGEMRQKVGIDDQQSAAVEKVLDSTKKKLDDLRRQERPQHDLVQQEQIDSIRNLLSDTQKTAYDAWRAERQKSYQSRRNKNM